ncbi:MAG: rhamnulokinase [Candidatus Latescibacteria bacterium]|nr:rhamnulokinase [Candidatus Latescibacterota bacterium]
MTTAKHRLLAFDLGAESGRALLGHFDGEKLRLEELHRFANGPVQVFDSLYWDPLRLFGEMTEALSMYRRQYGARLDALGVDTWGVDFALLGRGDVLLGNPHNYRDPRTDGMLEAAFQRVPQQEIFARTGVQFMKLNTLYQLLAMQRQGSPLLEVAETFLMMADLFNFFFTGVKTGEFSNATTTQFYDPSRGDWSTELLQQFGLPTHILPPIVEPGAVLGQLLPSLRQQTGLDPVRVLAPATHDTGSAVAAVPTADRDYAYISSGTWSLMGIEEDRPLLHEAALAHNFTNEGGVGGTFRFLKNIAGLWLMQECRRTWARQGREFSYDELTAKAQQAPPFAALIDPDDELFIAPGDMPARIVDYCRRSGQTPPAEEGGIIRTILESLALKYRHVLEHLDQIRGQRLARIHVVGGGIQNRLLCQFTASATGRPLLAGPLEATAIGNLMVQALGTGEVGSIDQARQVVRNSFAPDIYEPEDDSGAWDQAYVHFAALLPPA